jgi:chaperonin GroES
MNIRPLQDRVILKRVKEEEKTKGGIIIPDTAKEKPIEGEVVAVGNGKVLEDGTVRKLDVKVGDRVLFGKYSGTEVKLEGEERLIVREDDILAVLDKLARSLRPAPPTFKIQRSRTWQRKKSSTPRTRAT